MCSQLQVWETSFHTTKFFWNWRCIQCQNTRFESFHTTKFFWNFLEIIYVVRYLFVSTLLSSSETLYLCLLFLFQKIVSTLLSSSETQYYLPIVESWIFVSTLLSSSETLHRIIRNVIDPRFHTTKFFWNLQKRKQGRSWRDVSTLLSSSETRNRRSARRGAQ